MHVHVAATLLLLTQLHSLLHTACLSNTTTNQQQEPAAD